LNLLRRLYIQALLQEAGAAGKDKLLVDKNPSPTARLPVWLRVFPELRVLIALRDPRDVVLSCYFQHYSPTYQDVTRPVYTRSIGRWHAYEKHLAPILSKLERYCREFGY